MRSASTPTSGFDNEPRRVALAQALLILAPRELDSRVARLFAYAAAGLCPVDHADDSDAVRRHRARPVDPTAPSVNPIAGSVNLGEAA